MGRNHPEPPISADTDLRRKAEYRPEIKGDALIGRKFAIVYHARLGEIRAARRRGLVPS